MSRHTYTPALLQNLNTFGANFERDDIIAIYYHAGYTVREIIGFLVTRHGIAIGERQVHRILREKQLKRRENQSSLEEIVRALLHELAGSSRNMGGTENSIARDIQYGLRWNHNDPFQGISSFIYGSSNRNTRIERFWRSLREMVGNTWIDHFKDLADYGIMDTSDMIHLECSRFCFLHLIDTELDGVARHWNEHRIRKSKNVDLPAGKPDVLYFQPETYLARDYKMPLNGNLVALERQYGQNPPVRGVSVEFEELAGHLIRQNNLVYTPTTKDEATELFARLTNLIAQVN
uniref:Integrase core domain-containing protein n=1 Tax=Magallana gigas TaxID=29159 RepID=A0A8W8MNF1_MAGGI